MRRQKRDKNDRAYHLGFKAGIRGKSTGECPYHVAEMRGSWMGGWRDGRAEYKMGALDIESV